MARSLEDIALRIHQYSEYLKKDHYQFQAMETDTAEEPEPTLLYTCHICAIEVPAAFAREHAASIKHRANMRIASEFAERTRALITARPPPAGAQSKARFCANCATVVDEDHDKTKEHRVAVMHDSLLWDLMKLYTQDYSDDHKYEHDCADNQRNEKNVTDKVNNNKKDDVDLINIVGNHTNCNHLTEPQNAKNNCSMTLTGEKIEHKRKQEGEQFENNCRINGDPEKHKEDQAYKVETSQFDSINNNRTENIQSINQPQDMMETAPNSTGLRNPITNGIDTSANGVKHDDEDYGEKLRKLIKDKDSFKFYETALLTHIKINDDDLINIRNDNFHSYDRIHYSGRLKCIVCDCILDIKDAEDHKHDLKHMRRIINVGNDDHYVREIDEYYSHCILCNLKIRNTDVDMHKETSLHIVMKDVCTCKANKSEPDVTTAKDNSVIEHGNNENDKNTANRGTSSMDEKNKNGETVVADTSNITIGPEIEYPYEITATGSVRCVLCDCLVPSGVRNREEHIKWSGHRLTKDVAEYFNLTHLTCFTGKTKKKL